MEHGGLQEFCERWLAAWTGNHPERLIEFYADDAFYSDPGRPDGLRGREALLGYFRKLLAKYPEWSWKAVEILRHESGFSLKWEARLKPDSPAFYGFDLVELRGSRISRNEVYFDPAPLR